MSHFNDLSFLPEDYLATRRARRANRLFSALLAITIVVVAAAYVVVDASVLALRAEHRDVMQAYQQESIRLKQLDELRKQHDLIAYRARLAEALIEKNLRSELLTDLTDLLPPGTALLELNLESKARTRATPNPETNTKTAAAASKKKAKQPAEPPKPEPLVYDQSIRLVGVAYTDLQVARYMDALKRHPQFADVDLILSRQFEYQEEPVRRFEISLRLNDRPRPATQDRNGTLAGGN
jgi:Tfp pilus assembly protein PilN